MSNPLKGHIYFFKFKLTSGHRESYVVAPDLVDAIQQLYLYHEPTNSKFLEIKSCTAVGDEYSVLVSPQLFKTPTDEHTESH